VWVGLGDSPTAGQIGVECLTPETNIWDLDLSQRTDDEPLMQEIVVARAVQRWLFPREKPPLRTLDYSGKCVQARTVGGDTLPSAEHTEHSCRRFQTLDAPVFA